MREATRYKIASRSYTTSAGGGLKKGNSYTITLSTSALIDRSYSNKKLRALSTSGAQDGLLIQDELEYTTTSANGTREVVHAKFHSFP